MIRFCDKKQPESKELNLIIIAEKQYMNESLWKNGRAYFRPDHIERTITLPLLPLVDDDGKILCYGWQDDEADRELRMLKELGSNKEALQFRDVFPDVKEVLVNGCNELACYFVKYLENQQIKVSVTGKYWEYFGYKSVEETDYDDEKMMIHAERVLERTGSLYQRVIRSASAEFECIDLIYEENVKNGKIKNREGGGYWLFEKLKGKDVFLDGISDEEQDAYDLLYRHGVDIAGFIFGGEGWKGAKSFLGKQIVSVSQVMKCKDNAVVINCKDRNSALGTESEEYYHYYCGYERNEQYFMLKDYFEIPCSNLIHILKGKTVFLAGEERFCKILADYLEETEQGDIKVQSGDLPMCREMKETDIFCAVYPVDISGAYSKKTEKFWDEVLSIGTVRFTRYFSDSRVFVEIDRCRSKNTQKYVIPGLRPKGILLGAVPGYCGCVFFKGIMDGHPNIIAPPYNFWGDNLFLYCIRLAEEKPQNIVNVLKHILEEEYDPDRIAAMFPEWDLFKRGAEKWLLNKESVTSQELFIVFCASYTEMMTGEMLTDLSSKVVYWEPHGFFRHKFRFLEKWLGSAEINGQTMIIRRDNMTFGAAAYNGLLHRGKEFAGLEVLSILSQEYWINASQEETLSCHWQKLILRFEDVKLHPKEELLKVCDRMDIPWSDTMQYTTSYGKSDAYAGRSRDFTLKPVFDRRENVFSAFDQFRVAVISAPYQKKYGYSYVDCMKFSRSRLWEMFLDEFRFQQDMQFETQQSRAAYDIKGYASLRSQLWTARKHAVLDDIKPEFESVKIDRQEIKGKQKTVKMPVRTAAEKKEDLIEQVRRQKKLVLYGIGRDCGGLLQYLNEAEQDRLLFCDKKAEQGTCTYRGKKVLSPRELCEDYKDYGILITSSMFSTSIRWELEDMGICPDRIICNTVCLWR